MRIPIPYPHIIYLPDEHLVPKIKARFALETTEFFYGKAAPIFIKLYNNYYTDCDEVIEFIDDFYTDLMAVHPSMKSRKIDSFAYECQFKNWIGRVALIYCYAKYKIHEKEQAYLEDLQLNAGVEPLIHANISHLNREDVEWLLKSMPNQRYSRLIRLVYLEELSLQEAAKALDVNMANFFNLHRRAKLQYVQVFNKEMKR